MNTPHVLQAARSLPGLIPGIREPVVIVATENRTNTPRKHSRHRSLQTLAYGILLFVCMQGSVQLCARNDWLPLRDPVYAEKFDLLKRQPGMFTEDPGITRVLVLGSSRTMLGVDAKTLSQELTHRLGHATIAFNFGTSGGGPLTNMLYLQRILSSGCHPQIVIMEIHPTFLAEREEGDAAEGQWLFPHRLYSGEAEQLTAAGHATPVPDHLGWKGWVSATHAYRFPMLNHWYPRWLPCPHGLTLGALTDDHGWVGGLDVPPKNQDKLLLAAYCQYAPLLKNYSISPAALNALQVITHQCQQANIALVFMITPESSVFQSWYPEDAQPRFNAIVQSLEAESGRRVIDARHWLPDEGFADGHHVTPRGAAIWTQGLTESLHEWLPRGDSP